MLVYRVSGNTLIDDVTELLDTELPDEEWDTVGSSSSCSEIRNR